MRYIGHYADADTPAYSELAAASVPDRVANLTALIGRVRFAGRRHAAALPDVHLLRKSRLTKAEKQHLKSV